MNMFDRCAAIYRTHGTITELIQLALDLVASAGDVDDYFEIARLLTAADHLYADELIKRLQADPAEYAEFAQYIFAEHKPHLLSSTVFTGCSSSRLERYVGPQKYAMECAVELLSHPDLAAREAAKELLKLAPDEDFYWDPPRPKDFEPAAWQAWWQQKCEAKGPRWDEPALLPGE